MFSYPLSSSPSSLPARGPLRRCYVTVLRFSLPSSSSLNHTPPPKGPLLLLCYVTPSSSLAPFPCQATLTHQPGIARPSTRGSPPRRPSSQCRRAPPQPEYQITRRTAGVEGSAGQSGARRHFLMGDGWSKRGAAGIGKRGRGVEPGGFETVMVLCEVYSGSPDAPVGFYRSYPSEELYEGLGSVRER